MTVIPALVKTMEHVLTVWTITRALAYLDLKERTAQSVSSQTTLIIFFFLSYQSGTLNIVFIALLLFFLLFFFWSVNGVRVRVWSVNGAFSRQSKRHLKSKGAIVVIALHFGKWWLWSHNVITILAYTGSKSFFFLIRYWWLLSQPMWEQWNMYWRCEQLHLRLRTWIWRKELHYG